MPGFSLLIWKKFDDDAYDEYETGKIKKGTFDRIMKEYGINPAKYFLGVPSGPAK